MTQRKMREQWSAPVSFLPQLVPTIIKVSETFGGNNGNEGGNIVPIDKCLLRGEKGKAAYLGHARACYNMVLLTRMRKAWREDMEKAKYYYWELAAMEANVEARFNLGNFEEKIAGNMSRAMNHYRIAAGDGYDKSF